MTNILDRRHLLLAAVSAPLGIKLFSTATASSFAMSSSKIDFSNSKEFLDAFIKTEGDTSGDEVVLYGESNVYTYIPGRSDMHLFNMELFAVRRYLPTDGGWIRLHREAGIVRDKDTGEILSTWFNPLIDREVEIIELFQEFNRKYLSEDLGKTWDIGFMEKGGDVYFQRNFFLNEIAVLQPDEYPLHASDTHYELAEYINLFTTLDALEDGSITSAPAYGVTNSVGNWLPWMEMGTRPGNLIHQTRFKKLGSVAEIPDEIRTYVGAKDPKFLSAPTEFKEGDQHTTGLAFYKEVIDQRLGRK